MGSRRRRTSIDRGALKTWKLAKLSSAQTGPIDKWADVETRPMRGAHFIRLNRSRAPTPCAADKLLSLKCYSQEGGVLRTYPIGLFSATT
jgi:hypothetical protein